MTIEKVGDEFGIARDGFLMHLDRIMNGDDKMSKKYKVGDVVYLRGKIAEVDKHSDYPYEIFASDGENNEAIHDWVTEDSLYSLPNHDELINELIGEIQAYEKKYENEYRHSDVGNAVYYFDGILKACNDLIIQLKSKLSHQHDWKVFEITQVYKEKQSGNLIVTYKQVCDCGAFELKTDTVSPEWFHNNVPVWLFENAEGREPKVGDTVRVVSNDYDYYHYYEIGSIGHIINKERDDYGDGEMGYLIEINQERTQWLKRRHFEIITD